jgi:hypothetical protein
MKLPMSSPHAPGSGAAIPAPAVLNDRDDALAPMRAGEHSFQPIQKHLIEKHSASRDKRPFVEPGRGSPTSKKPDPSKLDCDNGHLGSFDELLHDIETWLAPRRAAVFGDHMSCATPLTAGLAEARDGAPPL